MALIEIQAIDDAGLIRVLSGITDLTNEFANSGNEFIAVQLTDGESETITIHVTITSVDTQQYGELTKSDIVRTILNNEILFIGPFPIGGFSDLDGNLSFTMSTTSGVRVGVFSMIK